MCVYVSACMRVCVRVHVCVSGDVCMRVRGYDCVLWVRGWRVCECECVYEAECVYMYV